MCICSIVDCFEQILCSVLVLMQSIRRIGMHFEKAAIRLAHQSLFLNRKDGLPLTFKLMKSSMCLQRLV